MRNLELKPPGSLDKLIFFGSTSNRFPLEACDYKRKVIAFVRLDNAGKVLTNILQKSKFYGWFGQGERAARRTS